MILLKDIPFSHLQTHIHWGNEQLWKCRFKSNVQMGLKSNFNIENEIWWAFFSPSCFRKFRVMFININNVFWYWLSGQWNILVSMTNRWLFHSLFVNVIRFLLQRHHQPIVVMFTKKTAKLSVFVCAEKERCSSSHGKTECTIWVFACFHYTYNICRKHQHISKMHYVFINVTQANQAAH